MKIKIINLTLTITFALLCSIAYSQSCFHPSQNIAPVSRFQENSFNSYLYFPDSCLIRAPHIPSLNFVSNDNNYTVEISFRALLMSTTRQTLVGQFYPDKGWYIIYNQNTGSVEFWITNPTSNNFTILSIAQVQPQQWHSYKIYFNKTANLFMTYLDGNNTHVYYNVSWNYTPTVNSALSIGARKVMINYGENNLSAADYLKGYFDDFLAKVNDTTVMNVNFNWGGGQYALDSATFFVNDRKYSDGTNSNDNTLAFSFGSSTGYDKRDPQWIHTNDNTETHYFTLGSGFYNWTETGTPESIEAWQANSVVYNGNLYVTGAHNRVNGNAVNQGDASYGISRWDTVQNKWKSVGPGINGYGLYAGTWNDNAANSYLVVTGAFAKLHDANNTVVNNIALWNDASQSWSPLTDSGGTGVFDTPYPAAGFVTTVYKGGLVIGGSFSKAGALNAKNIAMWSYDGSSYSWKAFGKGFNNAVFALAVYNNELYAGGDFSIANDSDFVYGIAKWDTTAARWRPVETNTGSDARTIQAFCVYNGALWAGGSFAKIDGIVCNGIGYYDGTAWHPIGTGNNTGLGGQTYYSGTGEITDMLADSSNLYICGSFTKVNGLICNKIAKFDGSSWCALGYGVDLRPEGLSMFNRKLVITGDLYSADGMNMNNIALYDFENATNGHIYLGTGNNSTIAANYSLSQNYPNPFNPSTTIKYSLLHDSKVSLKVYDLLGREVATIVNDFRQAGEYQAEFNASNFASGVYFYRLETDKFTSVKKMVLVK